MGCFDRVLIKCPKCGSLIEFQSKAGECNLDTYYERSVSPQIALDIQNKVEECPHCKTKIIALPAIPITEITMYGVELDEFKKTVSPDSINDAYN